MALVEKNAANDLNNAIRVITKDDYAKGAAALAEAFIDDDVARYFLDTPDRDNWSEARKWKLHSEMMEYITHAHATRGYATATGSQSDPYGSCALWLQPNSNIESLVTVLSSGLWRLFYKLSFTGLRRFFQEFIPLLDKTKTEVLGKDRCHDVYYLVYIGTKRSCRGQGLARRLIEDVTRKADEEGKACYLESSAEVNVKLYKKCGFEVRKRIWVGTGQKRAPLDIMVREPGGLLAMEAVDSGISMGEQETAQNAGQATGTEGKSK